LSATFTSSASIGGTNVRAVQFFSPTQNLVGRSVTASIAVDNPNGLPIKLQLFTGADPSLNYVWGNVTGVTGSALSAYSLAKGFNDLTVAVTDKASFCASAAGYWALWVDLAGSVTTTGTVTVYIKQVTIGAPGSVQGTGGASGTGGQTGSSGSSGSAGRSGTAGSPGVGGRTGSGGASGSPGSSSSSGSPGSSGTSGSAATAGATNAGAGGDEVQSAGSAGMAGSAELAGSTG
jgi:hypothetical protein